MPRAARPEAWRRLNPSPVPTSSEGVLTGGQTDSGWRGQVATFAVLGGTTFNLFLCFVQTRIMGVSDAHVMLAELILIASAFLAALSRRVDMYLLSALFISYMILLFALRGAIDLKALRDILIPIAFYFLGSAVQNARLADRLVTITILIALVVGLFEYLFLETYLDYFNVLGYFISRGTVTLEESFGATRGLFISGLRPEPRTLLPFLGQHRVSGVFLEPVSAGNFGAIIYAWALFRPAMRLRYFVIAAALTTIVLADARFGFFTCILVTLMLPFYRLVPRLVWAIMPFLMLTSVAVYGLATGADGGANDIAGRFSVTATLLTKLDFAVIIGAQTTDQFTADSGLAYTLTKFGIVGFVFLWAAFAYAPIKDRRAWTFHSMVMIYLLLLMLISNSFFSIKTAALVWFLVGTAGAVDWSRLSGEQTRPKPSNSLSVPRRGRSQQLRKNL
ncbi:UDP-phosphate alpha N-acetylglucosaminyltransferase [Rhizobium sp. G187]|uniref:UDP-phosphate alpha N-acetylglucosaminyltransferase n=1 Tax=Rhizobium sp. G187 TaxID=3451352 RepID=UPI003EE5A15E